jgi:DNA-binding NtrC family response regulator
MSYKEGKMESKTTQALESLKSMSVIDVTNLPTLQEVERQYLTLVLSKTAGNKPQAAKILGVTVKTVYNKLNEYKAQEAPATEPS